MSLATLNAWDKVEESGKRTESFTKNIQGPKEAFTDFLQRLTSGVNRIVSDSEVRQILIKSLTFDNADSESQRVIRSLKARSALLDTWIRNMADIGSYIYDATLIGEAISKRI